MSEKAIFRARFNAVQVCFMVGSIIFFAIINTSAFTEFDDWVKLGIYAGFVVCVAIAGVSPGSIKDLLEKAKKILDKDVPPEEKVAELMSIMTTVAAQLGYYWEKLNVDQGINLGVGSDWVETPKDVKQPEEPEEITI